MKTTSLILLPATQFTIANGNYDGVVTTFSSDPVKAPGYYLKTTNMQTLSWHVSNLAATITFEATLESDQNTDNYFKIGDNVTGTLGSPLTIDSSVNLEGNYTFIRVTVSDFHGGAITKIVLGY